MILEVEFPVPRYTAVGKIGNNSVILLLRQLRCHCNHDHNKFSSLSNTTVVAIYPKLCLWRRSLCSNLGGIGPEQLYRATLIMHLVCTSKICISIVFVSWKNCNTQVKSQKKVMENFRGQTRCLMANVQIANSKT